MTVEVSLSLEFADTLRW